MKKDDAKKLSENAIQELANQLSEGKSAELTRFLDTMSTFHNYSFGNCMLIARQRPAATLVAGYRAWRMHGRFVKKGEKGIVILAPMVSKSEADDGSETRRVFGFRATYVFDVSQTDGKELPDLNRLGGEPGDKLAKLHVAAMTFGIRVEYHEDLRGAYGVSKGGAITLLAGLSEAEEFNTLAHELGHELLHRGSERRVMSKSVKELEAEAVAYVVSRAAGLDNSLLHSADYICCHKGDAELLSKSLERIQKTASQVIEAMESAPAQPAGGVA